MKRLFLPAIFPLLSLLILSKPSTNYGKEIAGQYSNDTLQGIDSLTVMFASNYIYYYDNELRIDEQMNNFRMTTNKGIKRVLMRYEMETKEKNRQFLVILKVRNQQELNDHSKSSIAMIKATYVSKEEKLNDPESELIRATEKANGIKKD